MDEEPTKPRGWVIFAQWVTLIVALPCTMLWVLHDCGYEFISEEVATALTGVTLALICTNLFMREVGERIWRD